MTDERRDLRLRIAARFKEARTLAGLTQQAVADTLNLRRPSVSEIEAGRRGLSSVELYQMAVLTGFPVSDLLSPTPLEPIRFLACRVDESGGAAHTHARSDTR